MNIRPFFFYGRKNSLLALRFNERSWFEGIACAQQLLREPDGPNCCKLALSLETEL